MNWERSESPPLLQRKTERLAGETGVERAAALLRAGGLVAFPTETVYGLGADATSAGAVAGLYAAKKRPSFNPLIAHVADLGAAREQGAFDDIALILAWRFWPGPLTLVVRKAPTVTVCDLATAGLGTIALRVPGLDLARDLLRRAGVPIAAPSANHSGRISPTRAEHVLADLDGHVDAVLDAGPALVGIESTIVACLDGAVRLLRPGGLPREAIEGALGGRLVTIVDGVDAPPAPGMLSSHYAPCTPLRLGAQAVRAGEAALLFGSAPPDGLERARAVLNLSPAGDLIEAAANLFAHLRALDEAGASAIAVAPIPVDGLGAAIADRLRRAAAPRPAPASGAGW